MRTALIVGMIVGACAGCSGATPDDSETGDAKDPYHTARTRMIEAHLRGRGIEDERVLAAMGSVRREEFVPVSARDEAYADHPLPIGLDQTISQPYIVAYMTELAAPQPGDRALEIGTGSGYQAAVLSLLVDSVFTIEILPELTDRATATLTRLEYTNVVTKTGDGYLGWPEHAPFDVIIVTAAPDHVPQPLVDQLAPGGRLVIPVGSFWQQLRLITRTPEGSVVTEAKLDVRFVPMTGRAQEGSR